MVPIPCVPDCPKRSCRCHINCEKYKEYKEFQKLMKAQAAYNRDKNWFDKRFRR